MSSSVGVLSTVVQTDQAFVFARRAELGVRRPEAPVTLSGD